MNATRAAKKAKSSFITPSRQRRLNPRVGRFNRRYATGKIFGPQPWVETHG